LVLPEEVASLRLALDHTLSSTSESHPDERAMIAGLIERLEAEVAAAATRRRTELR
jgi:hypothetical protein